MHHSTIKLSCGTHTWFADCRACQLNSQLLLQPADECIVALQRLEFSLAILL